MYVPMYQQRYLGKLMNHLFLISVITFHSLPPSIWQKTFNKMQGIIIILVFIWAISKALRIFHILAQNFSFVSTNLGKRKLLRPVNCIDSMIYKTFLISILRIFAKVETTTTNCSHKNSSTNNYSNSNNFHFEPL